MKKPESLLRGRLIITVDDVQFYGLSWFPKKWMNGTTKKQHVVRKIMEKWPCFSCVSPAYSRYTKCLGYLGRPLAKRQQSLGRFVQNFRCDQLLDSVVTFRTSHRISPKQELCHKEWDKIVHKCSAKWPKKVPSPWKTVALSSKKLALHAMAASSCDFVALSAK